VVEKIQPENNRTFKTGSEDWTGGFTWHSDTLLGHQGYITCKVDEDNPIKTITLVYPAITLTAKKFNRFGALYCLTEFTIQPPAVDWELTDGGIFTYGEVNIYPHVPGWVPFGGDPGVPTGINVNGSTLIISVYALSGNYGEIAFDDFSLKPHGGIQHLPIMGAG
jgi:hypothetical protein